MREFKLNNGINTCLKINKNTPRIALTINISINNPEVVAGTYLLIARLLLKGTKNRKSDEIASILDENAIDFSAEMKYDYLRFRFVALNEDFELALNILSDVIMNSTFEEFEKERIKLKGELAAELDSAKVRVSDLFVKTIYKNHFYGNSYTKILEEIDKTTIDDIKSAYKSILEDSNKTIAVVGDFDENQTLESLNRYLSNIPAPKETTSKIEQLSECANEYTEFIKDDAQQAQILQGWIVPTIGNSDYAKLMLLNVILGASGLSSRLFLELREKKGLAYTVRSSYETKAKAAVFSIYIGTEPTNIKTSIDGFNEEIRKIKTELISETELHNAKNNIIGKQQFINETNAQQANLMAYYSINGYSFNYNNELIECLKKVTAKELMDCANKYFNDNYVVSIIKP